MLKLLTHVYTYVETYTVILAWIVVPLGFFAIWLFFHNHFGMFAKPGHGKNR